MKFSILVLIIISLISCDFKSKNKSFDFPDKKTIIIVKENSSLIVSKNENSFKTYQLKKGKNIVVVYERNGTTIADHDDYDAFFKEILCFEFSPKQTIKEIDYKDKELEKLHCTYIYRVSSEKPFKKVVNISKGNIKAKSLNDRWTFEVNIDSEYKYGGYFERKNSKTIEFKK